MLFKVICFSLLNNANAGVLVGNEHNKTSSKTKHVRRAHWYCIVTGTQWKYPTLPAINLAEFYNKCGPDCRSVSHPLNLSTQQPTHICPLPSKRESESERGRGRQIEKEKEEEKEGLAKIQQNNKQQTKVGGQSLIDEADGEKQISKVAHGSIPQKRLIF